MSRRLVACAVAALVVSAAPMSGQGAPWLARAAKPALFQPLRAPRGGFTVEIPKKGWVAVAGGGPVALAVVQRDGEASIFVEHARLKQALAPEEITDLFAELEVDLLRQRQPRSARHVARVLEAGGRRLIGIEFEQPGVTGPERVRQYSIPSGEDLFRIVCSTTVQRFDLYAPVFAHAATSFNIAPPGTNP